MMFEWLISLVPWWAGLTAAVTTVAVVWRFFGWQGALAAAADFLAALSYGKGRAEGEAIIEAEQKEKCAMRSKLNTIGSTLGH